MEAMCHSKSRGSSESCPQIGFREVTRERLDQSAWWRTNRAGGLPVNNHSTVEHAQRSVADREPAAQPHLVAAGTSEPNQPPLDLVDHERDYPEAAQQAIEASG